MQELTRSDDSEVRALSALRALEEERRARDPADALPTPAARGTGAISAVGEPPSRPGSEPATAPDVTEDSAVRALGVLAALDQERGEAVAPAPATPSSTELLAAAERERDLRAAAAEHAVDRYAAAEQALQGLAGDDPEERAAAEQALHRVADDAEAAVAAYEAAEAELARLAGQAPHPAHDAPSAPVAAAPALPKPTAAPAATSLPPDAPGEDAGAAPLAGAPFDLVAHDLAGHELPGHDLRARRRPVLAALGVAAMAGAVALVAVMFRISAPITPASFDDAPSSPGRVNAAKPVDAPREPNEVERARAAWEREQAERAARERRAREQRPRARRSKPEDNDPRLVVKCDPNDPLCGVD